jgi:hypothetical protein
MSEFLVVLAFQNEEPPRRSREGNTGGDPNPSCRHPSSLLLPSCRRWRTPPGEARAADGGGGAPTAAPIFLGPESGAPASSR